MFSLTEHKLFGHPDSQWKSRRCPVKRTRGKMAHWTPVFSQLGTVGVVLCSQADAHVLIGACWKPQHSLRQTAQTQSQTPECRVLVWFAGRGSNKGKTAGGKRQTINAAALPLSQCEMQREWIHTLGRWHSGENGLTLSSAGEGRVPSLSIWQRGHQRSVSFALPWGWAQPKHITACSTKRQSKIPKIHLPKKRDFTQIPLWLEGGDTSRRDAWALQTPFTTLSSIPPAQHSWQSLSFACHRHDTPHCPSD